MGPLILVLLAVVGIGALFGQKALLNSIYQKTGKNLSINAFWSAAAFAGFVVCVVVLFAGWDNAMSDLDGPIGIIIVVACIALWAALLVRNIKGAGLIGIGLTILQVLCGLFAFILGILSIVLKFVGLQLNVTNLMQVQMDESNAKQQKANKQRMEQAEQQEAYAQKTYGMTAQEAWDAGYKDIDPELLKK